jgi:hypothetical protein
VSKVGCLLTVFKREGVVERQLRALESQTIAVSDVRIWQNVAPEVAEVRRWPVPHVASYPNAGVWPRFLYGLEFDTEFLCVFDDDTIPGRRWIENCLGRMERQEGLYGTVGVIFPTGERAPRERYGWPRPENRTRQVDIVGHSWFFRRDWLRYYALEPRITPYHTCGEDYHFSVALQKHLGLSTYVPPHPPNHLEWWGSVAGHLGLDQHATWARPGEDERKRETHDGYRRAGWKVMSELRAEACSRPD